jgi:hypothetical protein
MLECSQIRAEKFWFLLSKGGEECQKLVHESMHEPLKDEKVLFILRGSVLIFCFIPESTDEGCERESDRRNIKTHNKCWSRVSSSDLTFLTFFFPSFLVSSLIASTLKWLKMRR